MTTNTLLRRMARFYGTHGHWPTLLRASSTDIHELMTELTREPLEEGEKPAELRWVGVSPDRDPRDRGTFLGMRVEACDGPWDVGDAPMAPLQSLGGGGGGGTSVMHHAAPWGPRR